jgi:hypothetical protein
VDVTDHPWIETTATVVAFELIKHGPHISTGKTADLQLPVMPRYAVTFTYHANSQQYSGQYIVHAEPVMGHTFTICYDPEDPQNNSGSENSLSLHPKMLRLVAAIAAFLLFFAIHWFRHYR